MTVSQKLMKPGSWELNLANDTPKSVRDDIAVKGYIVITPTWFDIRSVSDANILSLARYSGVVQETTTFSLSGDGLSALMGDGDGLGPVIGLISETAGTLSTWITSILAAVTSPNGITSGTVTNTGTNLTHSMYLMTVRAALDYVCAAVGAEWRVNPNGTLDAAAPATLFTSYTTPSSIVVRKEGGRDPNISGLTVDLLTEQTNARQWTSSVLLAGEGEGVALLEEVANIGVNPYLGFGGAALDMTRLVDSPSTEETNAAALAAASLNLFSSARREVSLSTSTYDVGRFVKPGDTIYVHDPDRGLVDTANQVFYRGQVLTPIRQRVYGYTWPVQRGMGVYYRTGAGVYTDLTPWIEWESGSTTYEIGAPDLPIDPDLIIPSSMTGPKTNHAILERRARGRVQTYTPTITQSGAITKTVTYASYVVNGNEVFGSVRLDLTAAGSANNPILVSLPETGAIALGLFTASGWVYDASTGTIYPAIVELASTTTVAFRDAAAPAAVGLMLGQTGTSFALALASGDAVSLSFHYFTA